MEETVYKKILNSISDINSQLLVYKILGYPEHDQDSIKDNLKAAIIGLYNLSIDIEHELDCYYIEKGEDIIKRYIKAVGTKTLESMQTALLEYLTHDVLKDYYPKANWADENSAMLFSVTAAGYYIAEKRKDNDLILAKDDLIIFYMGGLYKIYKALEKAIPATEPHSNREPEPINIHNLKTLNEKLLYLKHTGVYDCLKTKYLKNNGEPNKSKISKMIAHITAENPATIATLLDFLDNPYKAGKNNPYTAISIPVVLNALHDDVKIDVSELVEIQNKLYPHE